VTKPYELNFASRLNVSCSLPIILIMVKEGMPRNTFKIFIPTVSMLLLPVTFKARDCHNFVTV